MKIVSLVPSLTELLYDLGLEDQIVGRTKFCIHPKEKIRSATKIGGTKNVNIAKVAELAPDLIIANKEENTKADVEALMADHEVMVTDIKTFDDALIAIAQIAERTNTVSQGLEIITKIETAFAKLSKLPNTPSVCYLIWQDPYMTIGSDTYIHQMLEVCGYRNIAGDQTRYPVMTLEEMQAATPDFIFLSSEPFPFKQKHIDALQGDFPDTKIVLVDGEYFSWYGSRMIDATGYFAELAAELTD